MLTILLVMRRCGALSLSVGNYNEHLSGIFLHECFSLSLPQTHEQSPFGIPPPKPGGVFPHQ